MSNFVFSCVCNGREGAAAEIDTHLHANKLWTCTRLLESTWYIGGEDKPSSIVNYLVPALQDGDSFVLIEASRIQFESPLVSEEALAFDWRQHEGRA